MRPQQADTPRLADAGRDRRPLADFIDAIRAGRPPRVDGREGRKAVARIEAAYESQRTGRAVKL